MLFLEKPSRLHVINLKRMSSLVSSVVWIFPRKCWSTHLIIKILKTTWKQLNWTRRQNGTTTAGCLLWGVTRTGDTTRWCIRWSSGLRHIMMRSWSACFVSWSSSARQIQRPLRASVRILIWYSSHGGDLYLKKIIGHVIVLLQVSSLQIPPAFTNCWWFQEQIFFRFNKINWCHE